MRYIHQINDPFWGEISAFFNFIPQGYELVETPEHKKERLTLELEEKKKSLAYLEKRITALTAEIELEEKQLLGLP